MNNVLYDIFNNINEGIVILDYDMKICLWNNYMSIITKIDSKTAIGKHIYEIFPNMNKKYFNTSMSNVLNSGSKMFFSAALHKEFVPCKEYLNLKISRFEKKGCQYLLLEFIDVTNQFLQINQLKSYINNLYKVNKELKEKEKMIKELAYYDNLTGIANRALFYELADKFLETAKRENNLLSLMFIDIDKFKNINDTYGHKTGDEILVKVANILKKSIKKNDLVARFGGDEFLILLPKIENLNDYKLIVTKIMNRKKEIFENSKMDISLSIGISFYPYEGNSIDQLITKADKAMYLAKNKCEKDCIISNY